MLHPPITLREPTLADAPTIAELANNKKIWDNVRNRMPYPYGLTDAEKFIEQVIKEETSAVRAIIQDETIKGLVGLHAAQDVYTGTAELGYWIGEAYWGQGLASEAVRLISQIGFKELGLRRIYASVYEHNLASMRVLEKNGFEREGVARAAVLKNDMVLDEVRFGLVHADL
ncbi:MAG: GNAT family N-acetyltransferase [Bacteroidota bacterium]